MIRHTEEASEVVGVRLDTSEEVAMLELDYVTPGGIRKTLRVRHTDAFKVRSGIAEVFDEMDPEARKRSSFASLAQRAGS
ncbi:hypothetical protein ABZ192_12535 [Streptomyces sp. NPDC006235]|uniref:hypothetical protein n=1 Tax=Streptomyces sp. NPDC006235 TaxID=3156736 RepID=UPI0033B380DC